MRLVRSCMAMDAVLMGSSLRNGVTAAQYFGSATDRRREGGYFGPRILFSEDRSPTRWRLGVLPTVGVKSMCPSPGALVFGRGRGFTPGAGGVGPSNVGVRTWNHPGRSHVL